MNSKIVCSNCGAKDVMRVRKSVAEKVLNTLTFSLLQMQRYRCLSCLSSFMVSSTLRGGPAKTESSNTNP